MNEQFKASFNAIELSLKESLKSDRHLSFYHLVTEVAKTNSVVKNYEKELKEFGDIRNFLVHDDLREPNLLVTEKLVSKIKAIEEAIISPTTIESLYKKNIVYIDAQDYLSEVLTLINKTEYSQFPVFKDEEFVGLFTNKMITLWFARNSYRLQIDLKDVLVSDVMKVIDTDNRYQIIGQSESVYRIVDAFREKELQQKLVLLIVEDPAKAVSKDNLYKVMTVSDVGEILER